MDVLSLHWLQAEGSLWLLVRPKRRIGQGLVDGDAAAECWKEHPISRESSHLVVSMETSAQPSFTFPKLRVRVRRFFLVMEESPSCATPSAVLRALFLHSWLLF
jgi:hypothetical protein